MSNNETARLAVLIDADNAPASVPKELLEEVAKYGTATVKRTYGDGTTTNLVGWRRLPGATQPCTNCSPCSTRFVRVAPVSAPWPCSTCINDGHLPSQHPPQPPGDFGSDLCGLGSRYSPDSQARTCCLSPLKMASVILWGNPAGCSFLICA